MPILRGWLRAPEPMRWWGDADEQEALRGEPPKIRLMRGGLLPLKGRIFAYAQVSAVLWGPHPISAALPHAPCAIDPFIGDPAMIGRGHGSSYLRLLAER